MLRIFRAGTSRADVIVAVVSVLLAVAAAATTEPAMRHDWAPIVPGLISSVDSVSGWNPIGLGAPVGYPSSFEAVVVLGSIAGAIGSYGAHVAFMTAIFTVVVGGALYLSRRLAGDVFTHCALVMFATFNPWVYTQLVAGHTFMLLAYGATLWSFAEFFAERPDLRVLVLGAIATAPQIQFAVCDAVGVLFLTLRARDVRPLATVGATLLPVFVGVAMARGSLLGTPLTLAWERDQSILPFSAVALRGYFTHYDAALGPTLDASMVALVTIAIVGASTCAFRRRDIWVPVVTGCVLLFTMGLRGPLAGPIASAFERVPEVGLFRELYDLIGFVAVGYCFLIAAACSRWRALAVLACFAAAPLPILWALHPPETFWVDARVIPAAPIPASTTDRIAFTPASAPLRFRGRGSGVDPDAHRYPSGAVSLNDPERQFPIENALGEFQRSGSTSSLAALGVSTIVPRPWFSTDAESLRGQFALPPSSETRPPERRATISLRPAPSLSLSAPPSIGSLDRIQGSGNALFSDAADAPGFAFWKRFGTMEPVRADPAFVHESDGWVDARLAFFERPELAQSFGGALTTRPNVLIPVRGDRDTLVWVRGVLFDQDGRELVRNGPGYRWEYFDRRVRALRCRGECLVAAQGRVPPRLPFEPRGHVLDPLPHRTFAPWWIVAVVPPGPARLLRYNVRFDARWIAVSGGSVLPHLRIDTAVNGWLLEPTSAPERVVVFEYGAMVVSLAEIGAVIAQIAIVASLVGPATRGGSVVRTRREIRDDGVATR